MKRFQKQFQLLNLSVLFIGVLMICAWQNPSEKNTSINFSKNVNDTLPDDNNKALNQQELDRAMKQLDLSMADLDVQMKNLNINIDKQVEASLSKINFDDIAKQTEGSLKNIDWDKMQLDVDKSIASAKDEIAKVDFSKMQNEMQEMQKKLQSEEFKSQFNSEKLQKQINDAMITAKEGMEKAKVKMQHVKDFTDELAADNLIDKKKGYTIEWKNGSLFINDKEQSKNVSDKYRKYDDVGKIKMLPDNAEKF